MLEIHNFFFKEKRKTEAACIRLARIATNHEQDDTINDVFNDKALNEKSANGENFATAKTTNVRPLYRLYDFLLLFIVAH